MLCDGPYSDCVAAGGESKLKTDDDVVINEEGSATKVRKKAVLSEFNFLKRFEYEYFIRNIGMAAYRDDGSSIATSASNVDSQGTAYKIYSCGIFYGIGGSGETHNSDIEILIPLENVIVMPS